MNGELQENREEDVKVENVAQRSLSGKLLDRLGSGNAQEADAHEHTSDGDLVVAKLDTIEVLDRQRIGGDKTVEGENLVHLDGGDKSTSSLSDDVGDCP